MTKLSFIMPSVEQLIQDSRLWRGKHYRDEHSQPSKNSISSGIAQLDQQLHWRGWPLHSSSELLCEHWGIGELSLLMPLLKQVSLKGRIAWINPPFIPYPPALSAQGVIPEQCLLLYPSKPDQWWAAEQALNSSAFAIVMTWFTQQASHATPYRRLQAAAEKGHCLHFNFCPLQSKQQSSPARLRMQLSTSVSQLAIEVLKQPGGWAGQRFAIPRPESLLFKQQPVQQWPVYHSTRPSYPVINDKVSCSAITDPPYPDKLREDQPFIHQTDSNYPTQPH
ncbi:MAG: translesion DNA synthesis-associated protein ImuA [Oceanicoccus sp.]